MIYLLLHVLIQIHTQICYFYLVFTPPTIIMIMVNIGNILVVITTIISIIIVTIIISMVISIIIIFAAVFVAVHRI